MCNSVQYSISTAICQFCLAAKVCDGCGCGKCGCKCGWTEPSLWLVITELQRSRGNGSIKLNLARSVVIDRRYNFFWDDLVVGYKNISSASLGDIFRKISGAKLQKTKISSSFKTSHFHLKYSLLAWPFFCFLHNRHFPITGVQQECLLQILQQKSGNRLLFSSSSKFAHFRICTRQRRGSK